MSAIRTGLRQGSPEWLEARRSLVTATDLGVILGLNPWKSEWDLVEEKQNGWRQESSLPMRIGTALEPLIAAEYTRETGRRLQRMRDLVRHPTIPWAAASPDRRVVGERRLIELKWTTSRRWADGVPQDVEAQCMWTLGVLGWAEADVAVLVGGAELRIHPVEYDDETFEGLLEIAADFRARMAAGGPFSQTLDSLKRRYPSDDGTELVADAETSEAVATLLDVRGRRKALEADDERLEALIKARMAEATTLVGPGWRIHWKQTKEVSTTDWKSVAAGLLRQLPETERDALVGIHTSARPGFRPFRISMDHADAS